MSDNRNPMLGSFLFNPDGRYNYQPVLHYPSPGSFFLKQEGGTHYQDMKIQPIEYITANNLGFCEGNAVKYISRWKAKGGVQDIKKAIHYLQMIIELEEKNGNS